MYELADLVRRWVPDVRVAFADVRQPDVASVVAGCADAVVVPAFLAAGYHVRVDIPEQVAGTSSVITPHLGLDLVPVARRRLLDSGWTSGQPVVLAAAGSGDPAARAEVRAAARLLGADRVGFVTGSPALADVVTPEAAVASWFLAPGLFHQRARGTGAACVAEPLGADPAIAELIAQRYHHARSVRLTG